MGEGSVPGRPKRGPAPVTTCVTNHTMSDFAVASIETQLKLGVKDNSLVQASESLR